jgi:parallel beta-helix repeat protein
VSGGAKIDRSRGLTVRNSIFRNNLGPGLWFDESCYDAKVSRNQFVGNAGHGVSFEISSTGILVDNLVENNGGNGFKINDSNRVQLWNNTLIGNAPNIEVVQDSRRGSNLSIPGHDPRRPQPDPTEPWIIFDDTVMNNVLGPSAGTNPEVYVNDSSGQYSAAALRAMVDGDMFVRPTSASEITWGTGANHLQQYGSTAAFAAGTGLGSHNTEVVGQASLPTATQLAKASPLPMPSDVAAAAGVPAGSRFIGAF